MDKLNRTFKINPLYEADGYKLGHKPMLAESTVREYWTWIPRSLKYMHPSINKIMASGGQLVMRYIHSNFQELFFDRPKEEVDKFGRDISAYLGMEYNVQHFFDLYELGYLPIEVQSLEEGTFTKANVPHLAGINTVDGYAWLGLFLETLISKLAWQLPTAATIASKFRENANEWVRKTDVDNLGITEFMCHDFHSRGGNPFTSIAVSLGHSFSNKGTDTLNVIPASRYYYDTKEDEVEMFSVNASEHSVTCTGIFYYKNKLMQGLLDNEIEKFYSFEVPSEGNTKNPDILAIAEYLNLRDWLQKFPEGVLSVVSDTFDLWKLITYILPRLKDEILNRNGKLVIRPDSGDPVDIICGKSFTRDGEYVGLGKYEMSCDSEPDFKGVVELLWDIFGGTTNDQGYKVLDPHIGAIYGDSINLERQVNIYTKLAAKKFAATNIILGIGSYTYVMLTRDSAGYAAKGAWFETLENGVRENFTIYKDPVTDDGTKTSLKGFQLVTKTESGDIINESEVAEDIAFSDQNLLKTIYKNGKFYNQTTISNIREKVLTQINK